MKKIKSISILAVLLCSIACNSQEKLALNTEHDSTGNIYNYTMNIFLKNLEETLLSYKKKDSNFYKETNDYFQNLYILRSDFTSRSLSNISNSRIIFIDNENELKKIINPDGMKKLLRIIPLRKNDNYFLVNIVLFHCTLNDNNLEMANASGTSLQFTFDSESNTFTFIQDKE